MELPNEVEKEKIEKNREAAGTKMVISGALAAIVLWLTVLGIGDPITSFMYTSTSFAYALGVSAPAIVLSILAILKASRARRQSY